MIILMNTYFNIHGNKNRHCDDVYCMNPIVIRRKNSFIIRVLSTNKRIFIGPECDWQNKIRIFYLAHRSILLANGEISHHSLIH